MIETWGEKRDYQQKKHAHNDNVSAVKSFAYSAENDVRVNT